MGVLAETGLPFMTLGKGSNLLVSDKGIRGAVLLLSGELKRVELLPDGRVRAGAGASLASVCAFARERGLSGLEFAWGIPGSVGGAAYMDAGAYGGEMKDVVERVLHLSPSGEEGQATGGQLQFAYRKSRYTGGRDVITFVEFRLQPGGPCPDCREDGRVDGPPQGKTALRYAQGGQCVQASTGRLCCGPY